MTLQPIALEALPHDSSVSSAAHRPRKRRIASVLAAVVPTAMALLFGATSAQAFPGFIAGKGSTKRVNHVTHVVVAKRGDDNVVSIWPDYEGTLDRFALVFPVPDDVELDEVKTLKRDVIDRLDEITAPRFHEFWEMDPCEQGPAEQEWERDLTVKGGDMGFLGQAMPDFSSGTRLPPELLLNLNPPYKDGEYSFTLVPNGRSIEQFLKGKGLSVPSGAASALKRYEGAGMQWLVAEVEPSQVELAGANRALLSPIRFASAKPYDITSTLGLVNSAGKQELIVYVLHPDKKFEVANYPNVFPPTNAGVDFKVKERMGEFYAAVHDGLLAKNPKGILVEYAWPTIKQCGQPCPNEPLQISELLGFGGDFFDRNLAPKELSPEPPPMSEEEEKQFKAADKETKKRLKEQRVELMRRRALLDRNRYTVTRLHHRYDAAGLPEDIKLKPGGHVQGGLGEPKGPRGELPADVEPAEQSRLQTRYTFMHESKVVANCPNPERWRWGKAPRSYRGLRKIWTARDMDRKNRTQFALKDVITTSVPALGISAAAPAQEADAAPPPVADSKCSCELVASRRPGLEALAVVTALVLGSLRSARRRRA